MDQLLFEQLLVTLGPQMTPQAIAQILSTYTPMLSPMQMSSLNGRLAAIDGERKAQIALGDTGAITTSTGTGAAMTGSTSIASGEPQRRSVSTGTGVSSSQNTQVQANQVPGIGGGSGSGNHHNNPGATVTPGAPSASPVASQVKDLVGNTVQLDPTLREGLTPQKFVEKNKITETSAKDAFNRTPMDRASLVGNLYKTVLMRDASNEEKAGYHGMAESEIAATLKGSQEAKNLANKPAAEVKPQPQPQPKPQPEPEPKPVLPPSSDPDLVSKVLSAGSMLKQKTKIKLVTGEWIEVGG